MRSEEKHIDRFAMGRFVSELREQRGLSADDLARIVRTTPRRLLALAGYFEVSVAELFLGGRFAADDAPETVSAAQTAIFSSAPRAAACGCAVSLRC